MLTQQRLQQLVEYSPESGVFRARESRGNIAAGAVIGRKRSDGYVRLAIDGANYYAHRLALLYMTGSMPQMADHLDGDRSNNRYANLRPADITLNNRNAARKTGTASRFRGVSRKGSRWRACIRIDGGKHLYLVETKNEVEAAYRYDMASLQFHGEAGRRNFLPFVG